MKLVSFSVEYYRSITKARHIPLANYSLLIGANNEGKSNVLHALSIAMSALVYWHRYVRRTSDGRLIKSSLMHRPHHKFGYDWETDYPVSKQKRATSKSKTKILLEFELTELEVQEFKDDIKSNLNGTLPIQVSFGKEGFDVEVKKPGRGHATFTKKSNKIASFISRRIRFEYIPAIRTASSARDVIANLLERELMSLEDNPEYISALEKIEELQTPILDSLSETIQNTIGNFLPSVKSVNLLARKESRYRSLRRDVEIVVDDGFETKLERKGDGVQSLVALAMMRHASEENTTNLSTIIAIEEPESHLHPRAIHELKSVIEALSAKNQIVLTSHSPLFVDPTRLEHTVVVRASEAKCATKVSEIRDALGVRFSDNLENARIIVLVEGTDDQRALESIFKEKSGVLAKAIASGIVAFDSLGGASSLRSKASYFGVGACLVTCFLDNDGAGKSALEKAIGDKVVSVRDSALASVPHLEESELEDLYDLAVYSEAFEEQFGVDLLLKPRGKLKKKWAERTAQQFKTQGKPWDGKIKQETKDWLADFAAKNAGNILNKNHEVPIVKFIENLEKRLTQS